MWLDRLVIYLEKQIYRDTEKSPNGTTSLLVLLVDDIFEGGILSLILQCGCLAIDVMHYFSLLHLLIFCTFQKPEVACVV